MELLLIAVAVVVGGAAVWMLHDRIAADLAAAKARISALEDKIKAVTGKV